LARHKSISRQHTLSFDGKQIFGRQFIEVLKFHSPGLAPVQDESGSYHIDIQAINFTMTGSHGLLVSIATEQQLCKTTNVFTSQKRRAKHTHSLLDGQATFRKTFVQFVTATTNIFILTLTATEFTATVLFIVATSKTAMLV
jgi:hypothetical protein